MLTGAVIIDFEFVLGGSAHISDDDVSPACQGIIHLQGGWLPQVQDNTAFIPIHPHVCATVNTNARAKIPTIIPKRRFDFDNLSPQVC
jgi:hypothetical protein